MENLTAQKEEIFALQSIFGDDNLIVENATPPRGRFIVNVNVPTNFRILLKKRIDDFDEDSFNVEHLPPVNLFFEFPDTYPSETCPAFLISCTWLNLEELSRVCQELESIWERGAGEVVLFQWINFLQEEIFRFLHTVDTLDITKVSRYRYGVKNFRSVMGKTTIHFPEPLNAANSEISNITNKEPDVLKGADNASQHVDYLYMTLNFKPSIDRGTGPFDQRTVIDVMNDLPSVLQQYNKHKKQEVFQNMWFECLICFASKRGKDFMLFAKCNHMYCRQCLAAYFEIQIKDGNVGSLNCPGEKCPSQADGTQVKELVCSELFNKYDSLLLSRTLDGMSDVTYCPREDCQCAVLVESGSTMGSCPACKYAFCILCRMVFHGVAPCNFKNKHNQKLCKVYMNSRGKERSELEKRYGKKVLQLLTENVLSEEWKEEYSKKCPRCETSIEKNEGCNKMTCFRCGLYFCWICRVKLKPTNPYLHFSDPDSSCYKQLFPENHFYDEEFIEPGEFLHLIDE